MNQKLDEFVNIVNANLFTIYGEAGSGKSCFCLIAAINELKNKNRVLFLDTSNSFNLDRFKQLAGDDYEKLLDDLIIFKIKSFKDQQLKINNLDEVAKKFKAKLIVIDPISYYYRSLRTREPDLANRMLYSQMRTLKEISKDIPIIATSEVYMDIVANKIKYFGGRTISRFSDVIIELKKNPRKITFRKPEFNEINFKIDSAGFAVD